jgi:CheY-like chemotaxis protein
MARLEPTVRRSLVVEANMHAARLLVDIIKGLGARDVHVEQSEAKAMAVARDLEPTLVFTERSGPSLDGESFVRQLRRSHLACRSAPVIMVTADATANTIRGARDVGVHEFLRKPFTGADLFKRVENVALKPRDWIEGIAYVGPDRRRFNSGEYSGPQKRKNDKPTGAVAVAAAVKDQALRILAAALDQYDNDPAQALRATQQQAVTLKQLALKSSDARLAVAVAGLEVALSGGTANKASLAGPISGLLALADTDLTRKAG